MTLEETIIEPFDTTNSLVKIAAAFLVGVMLLGGFIGAAVSTDEPRSVTLTLTQIPNDGDTITLGAHVFEFDSGDGFTSGHIPVDIGVTLYDSTQNLETAVRDGTQFTVSSNID